MKKALLTILTLLLTVHAASGSVYFIEHGTAGNTTNITNNITNNITFNISAGIFNVQSIDDYVIVANGTTSNFSINETTLNTTIDERGVINGYLTSIPYQSSAAGWTNTTTTTSTSLLVNVTGAYSGDYSAVKLGNVGGYFFGADNAVPGYTNMMRLCSDTMRGDCVNVWNDGIGLETEGNIVANAGANMTFYGNGKYAVQSGGHVTFYSVGGNITFEPEAGNTYFYNSAYIDDSEICTADNGLCPPGTDGTGGWTNTSTTTSTDLDVNITARATTTVPLTINALTSQTGNLLVFKNGTGNIVSVIDEKGYFGYGTSAPASPFDMYSESTYQPQLGVNNVQNVAGGQAYINFRRARGTIASKTVVSSGDAIGAFIWQGWNGTAWRNAATFRGIVDGAPSTSVSGKIVFTTTNSAGTGIDRFVILADGKSGFYDMSPDAQVDIATSDAANIGLIVQGAASQTADMLEILTSTGTKQFTVSSAGEVNISTISGDGTGKAVCIKANGNLGTCTDAVGASGTCTCA